MLYVSSVLLAAYSCSLASLRAPLDSIARSIDGRVGAAVLLVETGEIVSIRGNERFPMQSVYKLPIAMAVLERVDRNQLRLDATVRVRAADIAPVHSPIREQHPGGGVDYTVRELLRLALVESDGTALDVLLRLVPAADVTRYIHGLGVDSLMVATTEKEMASADTVQYRNWATPEAGVQLLKRLQDGRGLSAASRTLLLQWLTESTPFPGRIRGLLPAGTAVAHKTGTSRTVDGLTRATNDIGLVTLTDGTHLAIAVFVADSRAPDAARDRVIARVAQAAWQCRTSR